MSETMNYDRLLLGTRARALTELIPGDLRKLGVHVHEARAGYSNDKCVELSSGALKTADGVRYLLRFQVAADSFLQALEIGIAMMKNALPEGSR